jgi:hypothetical protein
VDRSFSIAGEQLGITIDYRLPEFHRAGDYHHRHGEILRPGAGLCLIQHWSAFNVPTTDLVDQDLAAGVPIYLIADERAIPRRMRTVPPSV